MVTKEKTVEKTMERSESAKNDLVLIEQIKNGSERESNIAFEKLYKKYLYLIQYSCSKVTNDRTLMEDMINEAFAKIYVNIEKYNAETASFSTWLYTLSRNLFLDMHRRKKGEFYSLDVLTQPDEDEGEKNSYEVVSNDDNPEEIYEREEKIKKIKEVISMVFADKPHLKDLIIMRYFNEMSYEEISIATHKPLGTIKAHLHRAKNALQQVCLAKGISF